MLQIDSNTPHDGQDFGKGMEFDASTQVVSENYQWTNVILFHTVSSCSRRTYKRYKFPSMQQPNKTENSSTSTLLFVLAKFYYRIDNIISKVIPLHVLESLLADSFIMLSNYNYLIWY